VKFAWFCLLAGVLPATGETRWVPAAPITLYMSFQQEAPPTAVLDAIQEEVESIMTPIGLRFEWRKLSNQSSREVSAELAVVTFKGRCDTGGLRAQGKFSGALGWTHVSDGDILPFTDIGCDRVREFVQRALMAVSADDRQESYGRALGRVLAHELYHIFGNTTRHGSWGVAKECYTVQDLIGETFHFQDKESRLMRSNRPRPAVAVSGGTH
jgi:hypothetical protein